MAFEGKIPAARALSTEHKTRESLSLTLSTREDKEVVQAVDAAAFARGIKRSKFISEAVHRALIEPNEDSFRQLDKCISEAMIVPSNRLEKALERTGREWKIQSDRQVARLLQSQQNFETAIQSRDYGFAEYVLSELRNESLEQRKLLIATTALVTFVMIALSIACAYLVQQNLF